MPYGNFYVGKSGFLYKRNGAIGNRKNPQLGMIMGETYDINNRYIPGAGVTATSNNYAIRRKMIRNAANCALRGCNMNYYFLGAPLSYGK